MLNAVFARRFNELEAAFDRIPFKGGSRGYGESGYAESRDWMKWATSAQNLILAVFGEKSPHYANFVVARATCHGNEGDVRGLGGLFAGAKEDFEGGYVFNVELHVSGEVFGDFVALAKRALAEGHKDVAAVLACAALEDALKRFAAINAIDVDGKEMQDIVNALKGAGLVSGAQKSLLDPMPRIRNMAMHAEWAKLSEPDVNGVIGYVEQFLLTRFI